MNIQNKQTVLSILSDAIIFNRTFNGVSIILDAFKKADNDWEAQEQYRGYENTFVLLDVGSSIIKERLGNIFFDTINNDKDLTNSTELAKLILNEWNCHLNCHL